MRGRRPAVRPRGLGGGAAARRGPGGGLARGRGGESHPARPRPGRVHGGERPDPADRGARRVRARAALRPRRLPAAEGAPRPLVDARDLRADLRDVQDLPAAAGQVPGDSRGLHRRHHRRLLRRAAAFRAGAGGDHPGVQRARHRRQLRRGLVRHPDQHLRQFAHGVREPRWEGVPDLRDPAQGRHQHRHAAHQRRAVHDAGDPAVRPGRLRRAVLHRLRHRRVARRGRPAHRRRHLHEDRRHRVGPDEDRLQHQGRRRAQPGRHRRLHRRQRGRLGRADRGRLRDLRRHRRGADLVHPAGRARPEGPGPAARLDLRDAHHDDLRQRAVLPAQRRLGQGPVRRRRDDELRAPADDAGVADVDRVGRHHLRGVLPAHPRSRRRDAVVEAVDRHHVRDAGRRHHPGARQGVHVDDIGSREGSRDVGPRGRGVAEHPVGSGGRQLQRLLAGPGDRLADGHRVPGQHVVPRRR